MRFRQKPVGPWDTIDKNSIRLKNSNGCGLDRVSQKMSQATTVRFSGSAGAGIGQCFGIVVFDWGQFVSEDGKLVDRSDVAVG